MRSTNYATAFSFSVARVSAAPAVRLVARLILYLGACGLVQAQDFQLRVTAVDTAPALIIGNVTVSRYLVRKYYDRFVHEAMKVPGGPTTEQRRRWLQTFVAKQVVIAHAVELGYASRPDVARTVETMQRHMLTDHSTPYWAITGAPPAGAEALNRIYRGARDIYDGIVVRLDQAATITVGIGPTFATGPQDAQTAMIRHLIATDAGDSYEGRWRWPSPFPELADDLPSMEIGEWRRLDKPGFGTYFIFIRSIQRAAPPTGTIDHFAVAVGHHNEQVAERHHLFSTLASSQFRFDVATGNALMPLLRRMPSHESEVSDVVPNAIRGATLGEYLVAGAATRISVSAYIEWLNNRLIRHVPTSLLELRSSVRVMAVEDLDYRAALNAGYDQLPQVREDRAGFTGWQVLDLYERDVLAPTLSISPTDVKAYYDRHADEFRRVSDVRGRLLKFNDAEAAMKWLSNGPTVAPPLEDRFVDVRADSPLPGFENLHRAMFHQAAGRFGPIGYHGFAYVFEKTSDGGQTLMPLTQAAKSITASLTRERLDDAELAFAITYVRSHRYEDRIAYGELGLAAGPLLTYVAP